MENPLIAEKGGGGGSAGGGADEPTPQLFCLRWNNYQSNLTNVFDQLLQNESFVDVTLACSDGHSMKAHKVVLSACSPFFQTLLIDNPCKHPIVILNNIKWTELKAAVDFMYKGEINVCQEQIGPLLKVAESLKIRGLADVNNEQDFTSERKSPSATTAAALSASVEMNRSPIRVNSSNCLKRRRRASPDRGSSTNTEETLSVINSPSRALELVTSPSSSVGNGPSLPGCGITGVAGVQATAGAQNSAHSGGNRPSQSSTPQSPSNLNSSLSLPPPSAPLPGTSVADDMEIKPGIAEMIREEERAKLLESSHAAWLNPATSSIAYYQHSPTLTPPPLPLLSPVGDNNKKRNNYNNNKKSVRKKMKTPTWTKSKLREAMHAVITQKLRFTQAAAYYHIPKGTLYDNILGKSKRLRALEEYVLTPEEEMALLEFCCQVSVSPYNRRTRKPLNEVIDFLHRFSPNRVPPLEFTKSSGYRWWWAFCKKYNIVSLYFSNDLARNSQEDADYQAEDQPYDFSIRDSSNSNDNTLSTTYGSLQDYLKNFSMDSLNAAFDSANDVNRFASSFPAMQARSSPICL